jgi:glycosyltransferase involved in cell wall biosynthesis
MLSVIGQTYPHIEHIIIDGGSTDKTIDIIQRYNDHIQQLISEPDNGVYDAMNKGIKIATGDIAGMLNADDVLSTDDILMQVAQVFKQQAAQIVYGDLDYVSSEGEVVRKWRSGEYRKESFNKGWMPPHPTFYCKRALYFEYGFYSLDYGTAADYELMLRLMFKNNITAVHLPMVMVKMQIGGKSNQSLQNRVKASSNDLKAMRKNGIRLPWIAALLKPLSKIKQYF